jgi:hypothetical protein
VTAGYSGKPLHEKLGLGGAERLLVVDAPAGLVGSLLSVPPSLQVGDLRMRWADLILFFVESQARFRRRLPRVTGRLIPQGAVWVCWPKKASGVTTDVTEDVVRRIVLPVGLVDVKVAAIDDTWSGLKCVVRRELRSAWPPGPDSG